MSDADLIAQFAEYLEDLDSVPFAHEGNDAALMAVWDQERAR
jgi:hypothetical protein